MPVCKHAVPLVSMCWEPEQSSSTATRSIAWSATCPSWVRRSRCRVPEAYRTISHWRSTPTGNGYPATLSGAKKNEWAWRSIGSAKLAGRRHQRVARMRTHHRLRNTSHLQFAKVMDFAKRPIHPACRLQIDLLFRKNLLHGRPLQHPVLESRKVLQFSHRVASAKSPGIENQQVGISD
jgi:hypothetical protein